MPFDFDHVTVRPAVETALEAAAFDQQSDPVRHPRLERAAFAEQVPVAVVEPFGQPGQAQWPCVAHSGLDGVEQLGGEAGDVAGIEIAAAADDFGSDAAGFDEVAVYGTLAHAEQRSKLSHRRPVSQCHPRVDRLA